MLPRLPAGKTWLSVWSRLRSFFLRRWMAWRLTEATRPVALDGHFEAQGGKLVRDGEVPLGPGYFLGCLYRGFKIACLMHDQRNPAYFHGRD